MEIHGEIQTDTERTRGFGNVPPGVAKGIRDVLASLLKFLKLKGTKNVLLLITLIIESVCYL